MYVEEPQRLGLSFEEGGWFCDLDYGTDTSDARRSRGRADIAVYTSEQDRNQSARPVCVIRVFITRMATEQMGLQLVPDHVARAKAREMLREFIRREALPIGRRLEVTWTASQGIDRPQIATFFLNEDD